MSRVKDITGMKFGRLTVIKTREGRQRKFEFTSSRDV